MIDEGLILPGSGSGPAPAWNPLPGCDGVLLRDLAASAATGGRFSSLIARIAQGSEVSDHLHEDQWEWNMVLAGHGTLILGDETSTFRPGDTFTTPPQTRHTVIADSEDVFLLAVFVPGME